MNRIGRIGDGGSRISPDNIVEQATSALIGVLAATVIDSASSMRGALGSFLNGVGAR